MGPGQLLKVCHALCFIGLIFISTTVVPLCVTTFTQAHHFIRSGCRMSNAVLFIAFHLTTRTGSSSYSASVSQQVELNGCEQ